MSSSYGFELNLLTFSSVFGSMFVFCTALWAIKKAFEILEIF